MASIFTYETNPVRLGSPWPRAPVKGAETVSVDESSTFDVPPKERLSEYGITKLIPEPQDGPVEYKLHLLLRPRRIFSATSTVQKVSGSHLSKPRRPSSTVDSAPRSGPSTPTLTPSNVSRQNRLQHLTTQLLWRLQQSAPYHASSTSGLTLPVLPEAEVQMSVLKGPGKLISGIEESLGALYEIGVSDDGSFVGLTREELDESLMVMRAMSYSLGCTLQVLRMVDVGVCEWSEEMEILKRQPPRVHQDRLWVAEVLVGPNVGLPGQPSGYTPAYSKNINLASLNSRNISSMPREAFSESPDPQLRVTLTGSTTSGKSSLLGTLSTSTLDNGRGKSRLSLLKHRHEIVSGVTSSLAQELIGYRDMDSSQGLHPGAVQIVNYASANVSSWNDIHSTAHPGRLVFMTDSAGHPRYRRTTVRGIISWAPHWTLCCVAADDNEDNTGKVGATASANDILGSSGQGVDLSKAHLDLCMKLRLPLVVVITKYDLASKTGLRRTLTKVLSVLKDAGRKPVMLQLDTVVNGHNLPSQCVSTEEYDTAKEAILSVSPDQLPRLVPIVLTSVVTGVGISKVHSLLRQLPISPIPPRVAPQNFPDHAPLFHIDEVFTIARPDRSMSSMDFIVSGYLRHGMLEVGDSIHVGPFTEEASVETLENPTSQYASSYPGPRTSHPRTLNLQPKNHRASSGDLDRLAKTQDDNADKVNAWQLVRISSIRNLRLPVRQLYAGQVATVAINFQNTSSSPARNENSPALATLRRGMVLIRSAGSDGGSPPAYTTFTAHFKAPDTYVIPGSSVIVYIASIRARAKIVEVRVPDPTTQVDDDLFNFDRPRNDDDDGDRDNKAKGGEEEEEDDDDASMPTSSASSFLTDKDSQLDAIEITFKFTASTAEWIELGTQVLVTPASGLSMLNPLEPGESAGAGGGGGAAGLDGFVGQIVSAAAAR